MNQYNKISTLQYMGSKTRIISYDEDLFVPKLSFTLVTVALMC